MDNLTLTTATTPTDSTVQSFEARFLLSMLLSSIGTIICLSLLEKRTNQCCRTFGNRPGLIFPVNLLDHGYDNFGYAMAFGSIAGQCFRLFFRLYSAGIEPQWKTLVLMAIVLVLGLLFYPLFACLTTTWVFVGSLLGLAHSALWLYYNVRTLTDSTDDDQVTILSIVMLAPILLCLFCLFLRYCFMFLRHLVTVWNSRSISRVMGQHKRKHLGTCYNVAYVKQLLVPARFDVSCEDTNYIIPNINWRDKLSCCIRKYVYKNDPTFKYSPRIICIFTVALICAYQFGIILLIFAITFQKWTHEQCLTTNTTDNSSEVCLLGRVSEGSIIFSFVVSSLFTIYNSFQILTNYRRTIKQMYKGVFQQLPIKRNSESPYIILSNSLCYSGTQIAYLLLGYIITCAVLIIFCMTIMYLIILPIFGQVPPILYHILWNVLGTLEIALSQVLSSFTFVVVILTTERDLEVRQSNLSLLKRPGVVILPILRLLQRLSCWGMLQRRQTINEKGVVTSETVLALDNRKVYHNMTYFLFLLYIVLGLFSCFATIMKGVVLSVFYLPRMDCCGLVSGFEKWDTGFMNYVSFLHVEECHRHPVLLVFCDILLDLKHNRPSVPLTTYGANNSYIEDSTSDVSSPREGQVTGYIPPNRLLARNRWFKAYTMIRNPGLTQSDAREEFSGFHTDIEQSIEHDLTREQNA